MPPLPPLTGATLLGGGLAVLCLLVSLRTLWRAGWPALGATVAQALIMDGVLFTLGGESWLIPTLLIGAQLALLAGLPRPAARQRGRPGPRKATVTHERGTPYDRTHV